MRETRPETGKPSISGRTTIEGAAKRTAKEIADQLKIAFRKQGWI